MIVLLYTDTLSEDRTKQSFLQKPHLNGCQSIITVQCRIASGYPGDIAQDGGEAFKSNPASQVLISLRVSRTARQSIRSQVG